MVPLRNLTKIVGLRFETKDQSFASDRLNTIPNSESIWFWPVRSVRMAAILFYPGLVEKFFERRVGSGAELFRSGIMSFRQLFRRRLRRGVNHCQIKMRIGVVRIVRNGLEHFFLSRFLPTLLTGGDSQVVVGGRAFWIN